MIGFHPDWVTSGFQKMEDGSWIELGSVPGVALPRPARTPDLPVHDVADYLTRSDAEIAELRDKVAKLEGR